MRKVGSGRKLESWNREVYVFIISYRSWAINSLSAFVISNKRPKELTLPLENDFLIKTPTSSTSIFSLNVECLFRLAYSAVREKRNSRLQAVTS